QNRTAAQVCRQGDGGGVAVGVDLHVAKLERFERRGAQRRRDEGGLVEHPYGSEGEVVHQQRIQRLGVAPLQRREQLLLGGVALHRERFRADGVGDRGELPRRSQ